MRKICYVLFTLGAICLFCLFSCERSDTLYDILTESLAEEKTLSAGKILSYGRHYENAVSKDTVLDSLGISGYTEFTDRIEDYALYSTLNGEYSEIFMMRLYSVADTDDAVQMLERRKADIVKTLCAMGEKTDEEDIEIIKKDNTVALFFLPEGCEAEEKIRKRM